MNYLEKLQQSADKKATIRRLHKEGKTIRELAEQFGHRRQWIESILKEK